MPTKDEKVHEFLQGRYIAALGTENQDGTIHLTAVWYLFEDGDLFVSTNSDTHKARNVEARPRVCMMVDSRKPGSERGASTSGAAEIITSQQSQDLNSRIFSRYLSEAAIADPRVGPVLASMDDVTIRITPESWTFSSFVGMLGCQRGIILPQ